ncbi:hypothetical protein ACFWY5_39045 [Nonomuraea sp. NPDC059007]|uniref:hypothetical protein n=1 Tax=Nonomuraea sp. NPDC059007 TaxID=3346692 RepID=UPI0036B03E31
MINGGVLRDTAVFALDVEQGREGCCWGVTCYAVGVEVEALEERLVQETAVGFVCERVQVVWACEEVENGLQGGAAHVEIGLLCAAELCFQSGSLVTDAA